MQIDNRSQQIKQSKFLRGRNIIESVKRLAAKYAYCEKFKIEGLALTLKSVDPSLIQWVMKYLQPLSNGTDAPEIRKTSCMCLNSDELVVQAAIYLATPGITTYRVTGKNGGKLHCSRITINTTIYYNAKEGVFWLTEFDSSSVYIVHSSRSSQPALEFARTVRSVIMVYLEDQGWISYHAGAVETKNGLVMIVGNSGAGKTSLILDLLAGGARYVANERLLVRGNGNRFQALGYPMAIAVGLGTALQFHTLADLVENPDSLMYPPNRYSKSRVARTQHRERQNLEDKIQLLPQELIGYMNAPGISTGGNISALVVPKVNRSFDDAIVRPLSYEENIDILSQNYMGLTYDRSHPVWREADVQIKDNTTNDHSIDALSKINSVEFQYSLSSLRTAERHLNKICSTIPTYETIATKSTNEMN